ncbi:tRNA:m(4)X modification enzyme TRM13 homolog [Latimeria chalumnae]|nr:PREDICTED: tRNA:m(4)X modification enzyme TRM13 homolog [Latimeria chalumnae]|eukprot:XP_006000083.1 PREDICTED: tRNA:m(4)X modification enzyme TRM13 homolog [Latimeria chalumnae]
MAELTADGSSAPLPGRCRYFVEKKKRYCKMTVAEGKSLCGEHANNTEGENYRKRIPCPLDPKHTVYEDKLEKHMKKCNSREKPKPVYYVQDINGGTDDRLEAPREQVHISSLSQEELETVIRKLKMATSDLSSTLENQILSHQALHQALNDPKNGESAFKHLKQQSSLLGNMERLGLLGSSRCFIEFGAGRGKLAHWVDIALQDAKNVHFLLVERATTRFKVDGKHKNRDSVFERLQIDIQHLCLDKVPILMKKNLPVVGIGKHLCGAATDLALRCLVERNTAKYEADEEPPPKRSKTGLAEETDLVSESTKNSINEGKPTVPVAGIAIALCCHHRCEWKHYVGKELFSSLGLKAEEFSFFQRLSSWATCGRRRPKTETIQLGEASTDQKDDVEEHDLRDESSLLNSDNVDGLLSDEERENVGRLCKLLIDHGRVQYLEQKGFSASLQFYTSPSVSLENVLLTAVAGPTS